MSLKDKPIKLFLGCGPLPVDPQHLEIIDDTWTFIDLYIDDPKVVKMDIRKLDYKNETVDEIYCSHTLEHVPQEEVLSTLREWYRVLKKGGKVIINVPDMEYVAGSLLEMCGFSMSETDQLPDGQFGFKESRVYNTPHEIMKIIYGSQIHDGEYHKSGFVKETLTMDLRSGGFKNINIRQIYDNHDMGCLIAKAIK